MHSEFHPHISTPAPISPAFPTRTHRGSGERSITRNDLRSVAHLSQECAAAALHIGNTRFKSACRELGVRSWPYRRIKSVRSLKATLLDNMESSPDVSGAMF